MRVNFISDSQPLNTKKITLFLKKRLVISTVFLLLPLIVCKAQTKINFDYIKNNNDFIYPQSELDKVVPFENYKAVLFGETHTNFFEPQFKFYLIKHLNSLHNFRDVFMEVGYSTAFLMNKYLQTGDTTIIARTGTFYTNRYYRDFWQQLYDYNKALPEALKIRIHGVDFEGVAVFKVLLLLKPFQNQIPKELIKTFDDLNGLFAQTTNRKEFKRSFRKIRNDFQKYPVLVSKLYGTNADLVRKIIGNNTQMNFVKPRDRSMTKNMHREIKQFGIDKFIGIFGGDHINYESSTSISSVFKNTVEFQGKVLSIHSICFNAHSNFTNSILPYIGKGSRTKANELFNKYLTSNFRASIVNTIETGDAFLSEKADYFLFANDMTLLDK